MCNRDASFQDLRICVVIPAYKVSKQILRVIDSIGPEVTSILVIDDACPEKSGDFVLQNVNDSRVEVIKHHSNLGVGGAVKTGYRRALELNSNVVVKVDGDGQMDATKILELISPILNESVEYTKGNRFFEIEAIRAMPKIRIIGNLGLSFMTKLSTGYWRIFDPNNGFTAISGKSLSRLPLDKIDNGYFFESDMLFRLGLIDAEVLDIPIASIYADEVSNLQVRRVVIEFPVKHFRNFWKRILYVYYLREVNLASLELPAGFMLTVFGIGIGLKNWINGLLTGQESGTGALILTAMSILTGLQLILAFFSYDMSKNRK
jgi:dolichol-phosphate mannosyltransferase